MKNYRKIAVLSISVLCVITLFSGISHAGPTGITDSSHDLSVMGGPANWEFDTEERCVFCHTPHGANASATDRTFWDSGGGFQNAAGGTPAPLLLWNRELTTAATTYTLYTSSTFGGGSGKVRVYSMLCLSCHDGVSAMNVLINNPDDMIDISPADGRPDATTLNELDTFGHTDAPDVGFNIGDRWEDSGWGGGVTNLSNDHPVSINYNVAQGLDAGLRASTLSGTVRYVNDTRVKLFYREDKTVNDSLECSTCHDVHNEGDPNNGTYPFLVMTNEGSALCLQCHLK